MKRQLLITGIILSFLFCCANAEIPSESSSQTEVLTIDKTNLNDSSKHNNKEHSMKISISIKSDSGEHTLRATLLDNSSSAALYELLKQAPLTITMSDYGNFEKVGTLPQSLPRNDSQITTSPGDIILYQGNQITIYYDKNTWNFTRLGKIDDITQTELKKILGKGDVVATFLYIE